MLTTLLYSTLVGVYLPGKRCLLRSVETKLLFPVYIGDNLTVEGKVIEKPTEYRIITIKAIIRNQIGKKYRKQLYRSRSLHR